MSINLWHDTTASEPQAAPSYYNLDSSPLCPVLLSLVSITSCSTLFLLLLLLFVVVWEASLSIKQIKSVKSNQSKKPNPEQSQIHRKKEVDDVQRYSK